MKPLMQTNRVDKGIFPENLLRTYPTLLVILMEQHRVDHVVVERGFASIQVKMAQDILVWENGTNMKAESIDCTMGFIIVCQVPGYTKHPDLWRLTSSNQVSTTCWVYLLSPILIYKAGFAISNILKGLSIIFPSSTFIGNIIALQMPSQSMVFRLRLAAYILLCRLTRSSWMLEL